MTTQTPNQEKPTGNEIVEIGITRIDLRRPVRPIGEVLEELAPQGTKVKKTDFLDQDIIIHSVRFVKGKFGPFAFVVFTDQNGELFNTIISNKIVLPKLYVVAETLPVSARLVKREGGTYGEYYDIE